MCITIVYYTFVYCVMCTKPTTILYTQHNYVCGLWNHCGTGRSHATKLISFSLAAKFRKTDGICHLTDAINFPFK